MMPPAILYVCYFPVSDPLVETQVIAYLRGLAAHGHRVHLLTYETGALDRPTMARTRQRLRADGITWHRLRYHKRPSLLATAWDVMWGIVVGTVTVRRHRLGVVHARAHVPGAMALAIRRLTACRIVFDVRGLMAEEYVDAGHWREGNVPYRLTKWVERRCLAVASGVVVLTEAVRQRLFGDAHVTPAGSPIAVIPCCVDDEGIEARRPERVAMRQQLAIPEHTDVLVYVGKFSTWYMAAEMAAFFATLRRRTPDARFLVLTQSEPTLILDELAADGVPATSVTVMQVPPSEIGAYLAAADIAISFITPSPSKVASSPTKIGEYLAAGLPVVATSGVGDSDGLIAGNRVGVLVAQHDVETYQHAIDEIDALRQDADLADRCARTARECLSLTAVGVPAYVELYGRLRDDGRSVTSAS